MVYRKSLLLNGRSLSIMLWGAVILFLYFYLSTDSDFQFSLFHFMIVPLYSFVPLVSLAIIYLYFYVILTEEKLIIKSATLPFLKFECNYKDISSVHIKHTESSRGSVYMQIFLKDNTKSRRYFIDMVGKKDYKNIIKSIQSRGIVVEKWGLKDIL